MNIPHVIVTAEEWQQITDYDQLKALARELALVVEYVENFGDPDPYIMRGLTDRARKMGLLE